MKKESLEAIVYRRKAKCVKGHQHIVFSNQSNQNFLGKFSELSLTNGLHLFIFGEWHESTDSSVGGIVGITQGYLADCGNTGNITGISLAGGVAGFNDMGVLTRSYNSGYIKAPAYFSSFLPGGISHLLGRGKVVSYCAFEKGTAQVGASVFNGGTLLGIVPIDQKDFRNIHLLSNIFHISPAENTFAFASLDSYYPIPVGIFTENLEPPTLPQKGLKIDLPAISGVKYFYTLDGTDPHLADLEGEDFINL